MSDHGAREGFFRFVGVGVQGSLNANFGESWLAKSPSLVSVPSVKSVFSEKENLCEKFVFIHEVK